MPLRSVLLSLSLLLAAASLPAAQDLFVAGSEDNGRPAATLWRNSAASPLAGSTRTVRPTAMALADGNVYLCGWADAPPLTLRSTTRFVRTAMVWKNGAATPLTAGASWAVAMGLAAAGGELYVVGSEDERARLWKDGQPVPLELKGVESWARGVAKAGPDLLVVGNEWSGTDKTSVAMVWRNGKATPLTDGSRDACANAIAVSGPDWYAAGYESNGKVRVAKVWKNGKPFLTLSDGQRDAEAEAVKVAGDLVVTAGFEAVGDPLSNAGGAAGIWAPVATVWRNAAPVRLSDGKRYAWAHALDLAGGEVFAAGEELVTPDGNGNHSCVMVWKLDPAGRPEPAVRLTKGDTIANAVAVGVGTAAAR